LQLAKSVVVKKGDDYLNEISESNVEFQNGMYKDIQQPDDDWYTKRDKNKNINPYIFVR
jgi:hypothetical protein